MPSFAAVEVTLKLREVAMLTVIQLNYFGSTTVRGHGQSPITSSNANF
jgi:hypothetical protein